MTTPNRRISISASDYNQKMDKIIAKGTNVPDTLIALLYEANKYTIASGHKSVQGVHIRKGIKVGKSYKICSKNVKKSQNHTLKGGK